MNYSFSIDRTPVAKLLGEMAAIQWKLHDLFVEIANDPFCEPDLKFACDNDLIVFTRVFGSILVHYQIDHAVRNVVIIDYEKIIEMM